ncbi:unnamed protein product [Lactuca virosa]|uniref:DUF1764 domain-containing protein n=1 Tax=Lactuca virosa TaxID=75947 RepID=A0AAU9P2C4_9ASTR|nr:unnamed protein product [Lactuca virosa]
MSPQLVCANLRLTGNTHKQEIGVYDLLSSRPTDIIISSTFVIQKMPKKSSSKTQKAGLQNPVVATWEKPKKPPKNSPLPKEKVHSTPKSFGQEIEDIFSKKRKKPEQQKSKKRVKDGKHDESLDRKKPRNKSGGSNVKIFENEQTVTPKRKTGDGLVIYSEEELGIGKADAGGTRLCPFDCDCCF